MVFQCLKGDVIHMDCDGSRTRGNNPTALTLPLVSVIILLTIVFLINIESKRSFSNAVFSFLL